MSLSLSTFNSAEIHVVDPDPSMREELRLLLATLDVTVRTYPSAEAFLAQPLPSNSGCLITEVHLPGINGIELLEQLRGLGLELPAIILACQSDVPMAVRAMQTGAVDFLEKPFVNRLLLVRVRKILEKIY